MYWCEEKKKEITDMIGDCKVAFFEIRNDGRSNKDLLKLGYKADLYLGYSEKYNLFVAWNPFLHIEKHSVSIRIHPKKVYDNIVADTCQLNDGKSGYEKRLIFPKDKLKFFCNHWYELLFPAFEDYNGCDIDYMWADRDNPVPTPITKYEQDKDDKVYREKVVTERYKRDQSFRKRVLDLYKGKCAVCRCGIVEILEAAHITAVSDNGNDSVGNGILLCANHHLLFDKKMLKISDDYSFEAIDERLSNDSEFQRILQLYNGKIEMPVNKR